MTTAHLLALLGITLGAVSQNVTGMGFSLVAAPALVLDLGPRAGVAATLVLAVLASVAPLARDGRHAQARDVLRLLVPTLASTPVIALVVRAADPPWLAAAAGAAVVGAVCALATGVRWTWLRRRGGAVATGAASALLNVVGAVGGPPIGLYAANADWDPPRLRGNLNWFFLAQNCATAVAVGLWLPRPLEIAAVVSGSLCGSVLAPRTRPGTLRAGVLAIALLGGMGLIVGAG